MKSNKESGARCVASATLPAAIVGALLSSTPSAAAEAERSFEVYGFAQADYIQDIGGRLDKSWDDAFRPSKICLDGACGDDGQSSISVKQSRFGVKGALPTGASGTPLNFKFEFDLFGTGVDAGQTTFRLRHAYGEWGSFLAGQTNTPVHGWRHLSEHDRLLGPDGHGLLSQRPDPLDAVQDRYQSLRHRHRAAGQRHRRRQHSPDRGARRRGRSRTTKNCRTSPRSTASAATGATCSSAASCARSVSRSAQRAPAASGHSGSETGWGINVGSAINTFGNDKLLLSVVYGEGIASYMNDGGMDLAPSATFDCGRRSIRCEAEAVPLTGVMAYYDHYWSEKWSSSIGYSYTEVDNTNFQDPGAYNKGDYASVNLLTYSGGQHHVRRRVAMGQAQQQRRQFGR